MAGLYFHIPFCEHKCIYCDFYSVVPQSSAREVASFLTGLRTELELYGASPYHSSKYETVFFGGGTPSLLSPVDVEKILDLLRTRFSISQDAEITLETNPGTVDFERLRELRAAGITRVSIGVQSFHDDDLKFLTRIHSSSEAADCVRDAFRAGFDDVGIDLIFALPSQTSKRWLGTLDKAIALQPTHVSCYSLIVEPGTPLERLIASGQIQSLSVAADAELYELTIDTLVSRGYEQYEISNFARPGSQCRHNVNYWNHTNYIGLGPSAHSFWEGERWWNVSDANIYRNLLDSGRLPIEGRERLSPDELLEEDLYLGLRSSGIDVELFAARHGAWVLERFRSAMESLREEKMLAWEGNRIRLTPRGYALCDEICATLMR